MSEQAANAKDGIARFIDAIWISLRSIPSMDELMRCRSEDEPFCRICINCHPEELIEAISNIASYETGDSVPSHLLLVHS